MKDRQTQAPGAQPRIPIISPILHWLAMPCLVFLRSSFGYSFLSPKSVFIAFSWASVLFFVYAWMEPGAWRFNWAVAMFGLAAALLYALHVLAAFFRETQRKGKHDFYSGTSHLLRVPGFNQFRGNAAFETILHLWLEPVAIVMAATALRGFMGEHRLSFWLLIVAPAMWLKEFINYWYGIRAEKKLEDISEDAEEKMPRTAASINAPIPGAAGRKARIKRPANAEPEADAEPLHDRFAEILRLMPPASLDQAEANYRALMKIHHPDPNAASPENAAKAAELNDAIEHFRRKFGSE